jgi:hypothetical protein
MAKQSLGQKAHRVLRLLVGLRNPQVAGAMVAHGFTPADMQDGFQRLAALTGMRLDLQNPNKELQIPNKNPEIVRGVDDFENTWFPVARATLDARYPEIKRVLFRNLSQYSGVEVVISVGTFIKRLEQMEKGEGEFGDKGPEARALLAQRGLTKEKVAEVAVSIAAIATFTPEPVRQGPSAAEQKAAEDHMWAWYLEWSAIARAVIKDGRLLRGLGLGHRARTVDLETQTVAPALPPMLPANTTTPLLNATN